MPSIFQQPMPQIMGILNVTPDSFSDGGQFNHLTTAIEHAKMMIDAGVDIIDIGGQSTRPGYTEISPKEELKRLIPIIKELRTFTDLPISVDTYFPEVAEQSLLAGATIINDIKGMDIVGMADVVKDAQCDVVIMHSRKRNKELSFVCDLQNFYYEKADLCEKIGIKKEHICFDPGIGFHKSPEENIDVLRNSKNYRYLDYPLLIGVSRKRTIGSLCHETNPLNRDFGSVTASLLTIQQGAEIVRVHDVQGMRQALDVYQATK